MTSTLIFFLAAFLALLLYEYVYAKLLQLAQNAVRVSMGEPSRPVSFTGIFPPRP